MPIRPQNRNKTRSIGKESERAAAVGRQATLRRKEPPDTTGTIERLGRKELEGMVG